ncbi:MAG: hypothetical protein HRT71_09910 [Flavobacteriales bacterium]|nr:hypothetical protein [Flavobacteriales bacterium]
MNLGIPHEYRVTAYKNKGEFQHIYPVAFDRQGNQYVIDVVPEIPHFNFEAKPIIDLKIIDMKIVELSGLDDQEEIQDIMDELNEPFTLSGHEEVEAFEDEGAFLNGIEEIEDEDDAEIVLEGAEDVAELLENGILAEIAKAKDTLIQEQITPTTLSEAANVDAELEHIDSVLDAWGDEAEREEEIQEVIDSNSSYANFFRAILISLDRLDTEFDTLGGFDDEDPIFLAREESFDLSELIDDNVSLQGRAERKAKKAARKSKRADKKSARKSKPKKKGRLKNLVKKVGSGIKKAVKAVVKYNPASIAVRAAAIVAMKTNAGAMASKIIYGYVTPQQAKAKGFDLNEHRKFVALKDKVEGMFKKIGGNPKKLRKAVVTGRARKKTGISISGLGELGLIPFITTIISFFKQIGAKEDKLTANAVDLNINIPSSSDGGSDYQGDDYGSSSNLPVQQFDDSNLPANQNSSGSVMKKAKRFYSVHKKKIWWGGGITIALIVATLIYRMYKKKKKRSLSGIKAAKTRATRRKRTLASKTKQLKGSTTILKVPTKAVKRTRVKTRSNAARLKLMHKKAKQLQKAHPKMAYSKLLSKAASLI